jgi:hypothetical protein
VTPDFKRLLRPALDRTAPGRARAAQRWQEDPAADHLAPRHAAALDLEAVVPRRQRPRSTTPTSLHTEVASVKAVGEEGG